MLIELSEFNIKLLIPLIFPIFKRIGDFSKKAYVKKDNQQFKVFRYFLSYTLCFIPFLIIKLRTKNQDLKNTINEADDGPLTKSGEVNKLIKKKERRKKIKNIIFISILSIIGLFSNYYRYFFQKYESEYTKQSLGIFCDIFEYSALTYFILKQKLFKHHFISSGIITFVLLILFIITLFYINGRDIIPSFLFYFFLSLCFGTYDVLGKKYMEIFFSSPYFLMFIIGIINVSFLLIFEIFIYFLKSDIDGIFVGFNNNLTSASKYFIFILDIIVKFINNIGIWLTVYYLTPCHYFISSYISQYAYYIQEIIEKNNEFYSVINGVIFSIAFIINFFCCLVFNEVIILNFCGLDYNTKKRIQERVINDNSNFQSNYINETDEESSNERSGSGEDSTSYELKIVH